MSVVTFRGDADELGPLVAASRREGFRFMARFATELADGRFREPGAAVFGAYTENLVGIVGLTRDPYTEDALTGRVRHLYVLPAHRSAGVGRTLVAAVLEAARPCYHVLRLRTDTSSAAAFYRTLGFSETRQPHATHVLTL